MKAELVALRAENSEIKVLLKELNAAPAPEHSAKPKKARKSKAEPSGEPKEKKEPNDWIKFTTRIREMVNSIKDAPATKPTVVNQFASSLWQTKKEGWEDSDILAEWECFEPPEESKQSIAGKNKKAKGGSTGSAEDAEAEPEADAAGAGEKKKRKPQSEETKAAAAIKRAARKAAKTATVGGSEEAEAQVEKPAIKKITPKPKKVAETKVIDLALDEWEYEGEKYLKNERGDVLNIDGEWYGHWDGSKMDTDAAEPSDFETLAQRD